MSRLVRWIVLVASLLGAPLVSQSPCGVLEPTAESLNACLVSGDYRSAPWAHDAGPRLTGAIGTDGETYAVHGRARGYYSPLMTEWMAASRSPGGTSTAPPPAGAAAFLDVLADDGTTVQSTLMLLRHDVGSFDGWLWASGDPAGVSASFGSQKCHACHASAASFLTFVNYENVTTVMPDQTGYTPPPRPGTPLTPIALPRSNELSQSLPDAAAQPFIDFFERHADLELPNPSLSQVAALPPRSYDHFFPPATVVFPLTDETPTFVTSDQCAGCHGGAELLSGTQPNMVFSATAATEPDAPNRVDWSQYGEWSVSLMGLAGRDPVFMAQAETERTLKKGVDSVLIDNVCYSCHGSMGSRQYHQDRVPGEPPGFSHYMIYATPEDSEFRKQHAGRPPYDNPLTDPRFAPYGALARDGVSCAACHHIGPDSGRTVASPKPMTDPDEAPDFWELFYGPRDPSFSAREDPEGPPFHFTASFNTNASTLFGPCPDAKDCPDAGSAIDTADVNNWGHGQALGLDLAEQEYFSEAEVCGGCHVVLVPKVPDDYVGNPLTDARVGIAYEQTTYFEWAVSEYAAQDLPCQGCHMPDVTSGVAGDQRATTLDIANIESSTFPETKYRKGDSSIELENGNGLEARHYARHRLLGINLFVHEMFQQFHQLLGLGQLATQPEAEGVLLSLLDAKRSIVEHAIGDPPTAAVQICRVAASTEPSGQLDVGLLVTNNAGHKFPTGAGFRRAWVKLEVLDEQDQVLWVSGATNRYGALIDPTAPADDDVLENEFTRDPSKIQPHYDVIERQDQVQIYEVRSVDCRLAKDGGEEKLLCECPGPPGALLNNCSLPEGADPAAGPREPLLTSSTLTLFDDVKDNRILPRGWSLNLMEWTKGMAVEKLVEITAADGGAEDDPYYSEESPWLSGADRVDYSIALDDLSGKPASVRATVHYQTIPPYFLADRFRDGMKMKAEGRSPGVDTERLLYITSRLNTDVETPQELLPAGPSRQPDFVSKDWTMTLNVATFDLDETPPEYCEALEDQMKTRHQRMMSAARARLAAVRGYDLGVDP